MNIIISYLDTMFAAYPPSPKLVEARAELQAMMEDAYAAAKSAGLSENEAVGKVITEFGNLDELAPVLGISREISPEPQAQAQAQPPTHAQPQAQGQPQPATAAPQPTAPQPGPPLGRAAKHPPLSLDEAAAYGAARHEADSRLGLAVALLVSSPVALIVLTTLAERLGSQDGEGVAGFIGILILAACVAGGVLLLVGRAQKLTPFTRITRGHFSAGPDVMAWANTLASNEAPRRTGRLQIAIGLWVFALAPVVGAGMLADGWGGLGAACAILLVATGLLVFLPANWAASAAERIRQRSLVPSDQLAREEETSIVGAIASIYWPLTTLVYLLWSFLGNAWGSSWIIWPIAAVLFGAVAAGFGSWETYRAAKREER
ncbi:hypothetical protein FB468_1161 [Leucobacter komagatae]|uniref:Uncharacterized protein n=1 Tax=Leucobacter komagatae TaxID=55969 RepID=A0A542Y4Y9_9MICO|nr:permease prefix domain 1-containing protein [Leucobacter komagatae]TQL43146.1 hypothetical protein FB468_1161 [Leucobacter komagatae]